MKILYKNTDQLLSDAKKAYQELREMGLALSAKSVLDLIASCFSWESWNAMHTAGEKEPDSHTWWHDLRWRDKVRHLNRSIPEALASAPLKVASGGNMTPQDISRLKGMLMTILMPPAEPDIVSRKSSLMSRLRIKSSASCAEDAYRGLSLSRCREGVFVKAEDTLQFARHLADSFLPARQEPTCLMVCDVISLMDFSRELKRRGYQIALVNQSYSLARKVGAEHCSLLPSLDAGNDMRGGLLDYLIRYLGLSVTEANTGADFRHAGLIMAKMIAARVSAEGMGILPHHTLCVPSLQDCAKIILTHKNERVKRLAIELITYLFGACDDETLHQYADVINAPSSVEEVWSYLHLQLNAAVSELSDLYAGLDDASRKAAGISQFPREEGKVAYLFVVDDNEPADVFQMTTLLHMLLSHYAALPPSIANDIWAIAPAEMRFYSPLFNADGQRNFSLYNQARVNVLAYATPYHIVDYGEQFDTRVVLGDGISFVDERGKLALSDEDDTA